VAQLSVDGWQPNEDGVVMKFQRLVPSVPPDTVSLFARFNDIFYYRTSGITNHEEYSLVRELSDEDRMRTLTMKRDRSIAKDQKKLEEMKKKLHTDDECMCIMYVYIMLYAAY